MLLPLDRVESMVLCRVDLDLAQIERNRRLLPLDRSILGHLLTAALRKEALYSQLVRLIVYWLLHLLARNVAVAVNINPVAASMPSVTAAAMSPNQFTAFAAGPSSSTVDKVGELGFSFFSALPAYSSSRSPGSGT